MSLSCEPLGAPVRLYLEVLGLEQDEGREVKRVVRLEKVLGEVENEVMEWNQLLALRVQNTADRTVVTALTMLLFHPGAANHHFLASRVSVWTRAKKSGRGNQRNFLDSIGIGNVG